MKPSRFLAGGISNCERWQAGTASALWARSEFRDIYNPRRNEDIAKDGDEASNQIKWEHKALNEACSILFWFPDSPSHMPITLFELGSWLVRDKPLFIGVHPNYQRRFDVIIQVGLERPQQAIHSTLTETIGEATRWAYKQVQP